MSRLAMATAALVLVAGCSSTPGVDQTRLTLRRDVATIARASASGDRAAARAALVTLQDDLAIGTANGSIGAQEAARIRAALASLRADLAPSAPTSSPPSPRPAPTRSAPAPSKRHGHDAGQGQHGDGGDD